MNLKIPRIRRHHLQHGPRQIHIRAVLRKVRGKRQYLIPRLRHQPECMGQGARSPHRHEDMLLPVRQPEAPLQGSRHRFPDAGNTQAGAVSVKRIGLRLGQHLHHAVRKRLRYRHRRVSQAVIKHILISNLLSPGCSELRQLPDDRLCRKHILIFLNQHT